MPHSPKQPSPSFLTRVRESIPELHPTEKRLAEFVLDFPGELASYAASELARLAGVSNATVTRFIRRLGYSSFEAARRHVREEKETGSPLFLADRSVEGGRSRYQDSVEQGQENLRRTFARLSERTVDEIVTTLLEARKVWVTGFRSSQSLATYLQWQIFQVKEDIQVIPAPGGTFGEYIGSMSDKDLVIVFGLRRRPARLRNILTRITTSGARVLYITDGQLARNSAVTWHVQCACAGPGPLDNHVAVIALCHLLANNAIERSGPAGRERLAAIEAAHGELGEF